MKTEKERLSARVDAIVIWLRSQSTGPMTQNPEHSETVTMLDETANAIEAMRDSIAVKDEALREALQRVALMTPMGHDGMDDLLRSAIDASADQADMTRNNIRAALSR